MAIIRDEERKLRAGQNPSTKPIVEEAMALLKLYRREIVDDIVESTRRRYVAKGELKAGVDMHEQFRPLEGNSKAEALIASWLKEYDPSLKATVKIGPDCSGNLQYHPELVVTFTPA